MITYQQEFLATVKDDIQPLLEKHWEEVAHNKDKIKLEPSWEAYKALDEIGVVKIFTARQGPRLVGYFALLVSPNLHYASHTFAVNDVIFVDPRYRKGSVGMKLMKFAEKCLKEDGVSLMIVNTKLKKNFGPLLERLGYTPTEINYTKYIGK